MCSHAAGFDSVSATRVVGNQIELATVLVKSPGDALQCRLCLQLKFLSILSQCELAGIGRQVRLSLCRPDIRFYQIPDLLGAGASCQGIYGIERGQAGTP